MTKQEFHNHYEDWGARGNWEQERGLTEDEQMAREWERLNKEPE